MRVVALLSGLLLLGNCVAAPPPSVARTGDGWQIASPDSLGMDGAALARLTSAIRGGHWGNIHALLVARRGHLIYEEYFAGEDQRLGTPVGRVVFGSDTLHDIRSMSKTITSTLIGIAQGRGQIKSLDTPLVDLLPRYAHLLTSGKQHITLGHVLTMSAGLHWDEETLPYSDSLNDERRLSKSPDPTAFVLGQPLVAPPGDVFTYSGGLTHLLGAVLEEATGLSVDGYANEVLFAPLGIERWEWMSSGTARPSTFSGLRLRPRDVAKVGQVFLDGGQWNGAAIVPESWVEEARRAHITFDDPDAPAFVGMSGYGYQWWTNRYTTRLGELVVVSAIGNGEQRLILVPDLSLAVVVFAGFYNDPDNSWTPEHILVDHVLSSISDPSRED